MARKKSFATPISAAVTMLHYKDDGWHLYIDNRKVVAIDFDKVLVEGDDTVEDVKWVKLNTTIAVKAVKGRNSIELFPKGAISTRADKPSESTHRRTLYFED